MFLEIVLAEFLVYTVESGFVMIYQNYACRIMMADLQYQFRADGATSAGNQDHTIADKLANLGIIGHDWLPSKDILDFYLPDAVYANFAKVHALQGPECLGRFSCAGTNLPNSLEFLQGGAGNCDEDLVDVFGFDDLWNLFCRAVDGHTVDFKTLELRIVVDKGNHLYGEVGLFLDTLNYPLSGRPSADYKQVSCRCHLF